MSEVFCRSKSCKGFSSRLSKRGHLRGSDAVGSLGEGNIFPEALLITTTFLEDIKAISVFLCEF